MFFYFFILNFISNLAFLLYGRSIWAIFCMAGTAGLIAFFESFIILQIKNKYISRSMFFLFASFHSLIILGDYYLIFNFKMLLNQDVIDILSETNADQTADFIQTYLSLWKIGIWLLFIILLNLFAFYISKLVAGKIFGLIKCFLILMGIIALGITIYSFALYRNGKSVPQYVAPARLSYSVFILKQRISSIKELRNICHNTDAVADIGQSPSVIVVIGESFSKFHCSLYGYEKKTYPLLEARRDSGDLLIMKDAVAIADATHSNMKAIFSLGNEDNEFNTNPLFPTCFKAAGYKTKLYDNQYFLGHGITFLSDIKLNDEMFNFRNSHGYQYDGDMIESIKKEGCPTLYVIHLWGHHYAYENRYPKVFAKFNEGDYVSDGHALVKAHYDNANYYNDYVIDEIIKLFENDDAILVYFSDHGEEVYELGYMGHGTSTTSKDIRYQLAVPFIVWTSDSFRNRHPYVYNNLKNSENVPIMTKDISHFLLDVASIQTMYFKKERSFINADYYINKRRIVMHSLDYDEIVNKYSNSPFEMQFP